MHSDPAAGIPDRVLCSLGQLHQRSGGIRRILQPETSLDAFHDGKRRRPSPILETHDQRQREHLLPLHLLPGGAARGLSPLPWNHLHDDLWSHGCSGQGMDNDPQRLVVGPHQPRAHRHLRHIVFQGQGSSSGEIIRLRQLLPDYTSIHHSYILTSYCEIHKMQSLCRDAIQIF